MFKFGNTLPFIISVAFLFTGSWGHDAVAEEGGGEQVRPGEGEAERLFESAEQKSQAFQAVTITFPNRSLKERIEEKAKLYAEARASYREVIDLQSETYTVESAFRIAEMALDIRDQLKALPIPPSLVTSPALADYRVWLDDELISPAQDEAVRALAFASELALSFDMAVQLRAVERLRTIGLLEEKAIGPLLESSYPEVREAASHLLP